MGWAQSYKAWIDNSESIKEGQVTLLNEQMLRKILTEDDEQRKTYNVKSWGFFRSVLPDLDKEINPQVLNLGTQININEAITQSSSLILTSWVPTFTGQNHLFMTSFSGQPAATEALKINSFKFIKSNIIDTTWVFENKKCKIFLHSLHQSVKWPQTPLNMHGGTILFPFLWWTFLQFLLGLFLRTHTCHSIAFIWKLKN